MASNELMSRRLHMVQAHLVRRGIRDSNVLRAFSEVRREAFVPEPLVEFAYEDSALPIGEGQTISQPFIVARMVEALGLRGKERVLEVGAGSGYAAAILARLAREVWAIERIPALCEAATTRLAQEGFDRVSIVCGDGSRGLSEHAPFDAIVVAAGGPRPPASLLSQLAIGGKMVIPVGEGGTSQTLLRVTRTGPDDFHEEWLNEVRFVPLIGEEAWSEREAWLAERPRGSDAAITAFLVRETAEPIDDIDTGTIDAMVDRVADARLVLLGEATHGSSEFYRMRARITRELITKRGFNFVAVEADWPDAARVDDYVLGVPRRSSVEFTPFGRFPTWMWRNSEVHDFADWLRAYNADHLAARIGFHGLDLYSLFTSIAAVLSYLDRVDPEAARVARHRYAELTPWQKDPAAYGKAVLVGRYKSSEEAVVSMLRDMLEKRMDYAYKDGERFFDAAQNARVVAAAERYYRSMYYGAAASWNQRDQHMFDTLRSLFSYYGPHAKGVVWAHNSHVGDAAATEMSARGELNVGQLCRQAFGTSLYTIGFGTDHGTVAAAPAWAAGLETMHVRPALAGSYLDVFHRTGRPAFTLPISRHARRAVHDELSRPRLERAIGVVYRPDTELESHYYQSILPQEFDEIVWFDETHAVSALAVPPPLRSPDLPDTYPFGL